MFFYSEATYVIRFTPRKPNSVWSAATRSRDINSIDFANGGRAGIGVVIAAR